MREVCMKLVSAVVAALLCASVATAGQQSFDQVVARLKAPDAGTRRSALAMLVDSGYPEAAEPVASLLQDPDGRIQREAVYAELGLLLGEKVRTRRHVALVVEVRDTQPAARLFEAGLPELPIAPVPWAVVSGLLGPIRDPDTAFRIEATYALGILGRIQGAPPRDSYRAVADALAERLGDAEPQERAVAALAAGRVFGGCTAPCGVAGIDRLGDALVHTLNDPEDRVRWAAMEALGDLRWDRAVQSLTDVYNYYGKGRNALAALSALARIGHASSSGLFGAALSRKEEAFRVIGAEGLARIGTKDAAARAEAALTAAPSPALQLAAAFASYRAGVPGQLETLMRGIESRRMRSQAQGYLIDLGTLAAPAVASALGSSPAEGRVALLEVLSVIGGADQVAAVAALQNDGSADVAATAVLVVQRIKARH